jgi:hypothetical protein
MSKRCCKVVLMRTMEGFNRDEGQELLGQRSELKATSEL